MTHLPKEEKLKMDDSDDPIEPIVSHMVLASADYDGNDPAFAAEIVGRFLEEIQEPEPAEPNHPTDVNGEVLGVGDVVETLIINAPGIVTGFSGDDLARVSHHDGSSQMEGMHIQKLHTLTPAQYTPLARRTLPDDMTGRERLSMLAMGIIGEIGELNVEQTADEVSDVLWYAHLLLDECDRQDIGHSDDRAMINSITDAVALTFDATCSWLVETVKKSVFHDVDPENLRTLAVAALDYCEDLEFVDGLGAVRLANVQKLYRRYPEGFTTGGGNRE